MEGLDFAKTVPKWMNQSYFENVVRHMENDSAAEVEDFTLSSGSKLGDHYGSSIFCATINFKSKFTDGKSKKLSVIIKTQMIDGNYDEKNFKLLTESPLFRIEMAVFGKVLPEVQSLWEAVGDDESLSPR